MMGLIMVTGASTGLGQATASALAADGHDVVVHAREESRFTDQGWLGRMSGALYGDLSSSAETVELAERANTIGRFDAVIHNAGVGDGSPSSLLVEVNLVAPYLLTALMDRPARLIYLSSSMHRSGSTQLQGLTGRTSYSDSKLWLTALALGVARRWEGTVSHAVDPGWVPTRMGGRHATDDLEAGHQTQAWLATASETDPLTGGYWYHRRTQQPHAAAQDVRFQAEVIAALESHTGTALG